MYKKKGMEFSKKLMIAVSILTILITAISIAVVIITKDTSPLSFLIPAIFAEFATATAFYYRKAEAENKIKITLGSIDSLRGKNIDEHAITEIVRNIMSNLGL